MVVVVVLGGGGGDINSMSGTGLNMDNFVSCAPGEELTVIEYSAHATGGNSSTIHTARRRPQHQLHFTSTVNCAPEMQSINGNFRASCKNNGLLRPLRTDLCKICLW